MSRVATPPLREGFTTGTAAAGAALAALILLRTGHAPQSVHVPLPPFMPAGGEDAFSGRCARDWRVLSVAHCAAGLAPELLEKPLPELEAHLRLNRAPGPDERGAFRAAHASILKDGGDDPDATSGALITASVVLRNSPTHPLPPEDEDFTRIEGGPGVGRVTLPGLPLPVGAAAINPVPQEQIRFALGHEAARLAAPGAPCPPLTVIISVPRGADMARRTFNPRLGIVGGISILGTQGTVRPYSHAAWRATIAQGLNVALATGCRAVCLSTGRRSERLLMARYPDLAPQAFVQAADFAQFSLREAGSLPVERLIWGCFFGKLVKLAQGHAYTHARDAHLDMAALAELCRKAGVARAPAVAACVTAAHALELLLADPAGQDALTAVARQAARTARKFAGRRVVLHLFHTDGRELLTL